MRHRALYLQIVWRLFYEKKVIYGVVNILLAISFAFIALFFGAAVAVLLGLLSFILILYGVYAIFEYGIGAGIIIILIGIGLQGLGSSSSASKVIPIVAGVIIALFALYSFGMLSVHRTTVSKILGILAPISMLVGAYGLIAKPVLEDFLTLAGALWIIATIIDLVYWDKAPSKRERSRATSSQRSSYSSSSSSSSTPSVRYSTQGDVDRAMQKVASNHSRNETISTGMRTMSLYVKVNVSVWTPKIKFVVDIDVHGARNFYSQAEVDSAQDALARKFDEISSDIMRSAEKAFSSLMTREEYTVDIEAGKINTYD